MVHFDVILPENRLDLRQAIEHKCLPVDHAFARTRAMMLEQIHAQRVSHSQDKLIR
jgi:hypothetical protein